MAQSVTSPRTVTYDHPSSSSSSSSAGSTGSSWARSDVSSAPTSDSESTPFGSRKQNVIVGGLLAAGADVEARSPFATMGEEQLDAALWSPPTSSAPLISANGDKSYQKFHSPPQSIGSGSPPDRNAPADGSAAARTSNHLHAQAGMNGLSPHVEPFNPTSAAKQYPQTAAYSRLLGPRSDYPQPPADKRPAHEQSSPEAPRASTFSQDAHGFEPYGSASLQTSREPQAAAGNSNNEEISTIFVVGFPDDLQEREFQNMFIFSPGFEAATLKVPSMPIRDREQSQSSRGGMAAFAFDQDDDISAQSSARKQIIGFAKFRTRAEAIDARNVLSGRKVDAEKGSVLKAEMAKKNLHTKRGLANDAVSGVGNPTGNASLQSLPALLAGMLQNQQLPSGVLDTAVTSLLRQDHMERDTRSQIQQSAAYDAFHSMPANAAAPNGSFPFQNPSSPPPPASTPRMSSSQPAQPHQSHQTLNARQEYANLRNEGGLRGDHSRGRSPPRNIPGSDEIHTPPFAKSLMQQLDADTDDLITTRPTSGHVPTFSMEAGNRRTAAYTELPPASSNPQPYFSAVPDEGFNAGALRDRMTSLSLNTQSQSMPTTSSVSSPPTTLSPTFPRTQNPADQNPPINTLYVGGLPAVQPSLMGPMSAAHLEDCLRNAFSRSPGFRRLCFRQKSNGPMCFVEFDDVHFASRALSEMYGNTLNGLVKGGIRLSFSKNPLGVRTGSVSSGTGPLSPTSASAFLPPVESMSGNMSTSPAPSSSLSSISSGHPRRPSDSSYYMSPTSNAPRSLTPRSIISPATSMSSLQNANAFSPFGYAAPPVGESI